MSGHYSSDLKGSIATSGNAAYGTAQGKQEEGDGADEYQYVPSEPCELQNFTTLAGY